MHTNSLIALGLGAALLACSSGTKVAEEDHGNYTPPSSSSSGDVGGGGSSSSSGYDPIVRDGGASDTRNYFQTKSATQLRASIEQCVGANKTTISEDMLVRATVGPPATCGVANNDACFFLPRGLFSAGVDVVSAQTTVFDGAESATRQGTRPDQLGVEVLTALQAVGNVVGSACARRPDDIDCGCGSVDAARAMVARCLPSFDPTTAEYEAAVSALQTTCGASPGAAIASMIASYAFLRVN